MENSNSKCALRSIDTPQLVWLVTGSSSGFGLAMVENLLSSTNHNVIATLRKPSDISELASKYPASRLLVLRVDVTSPTEITEAFAKGVSTFGRIDVVFNNAGYVLQAELEAAPEEEAKAMFEVNFWGAMRVGTEATKVFRDINGLDEDGKPRGGLLLNNCSYTAVIGVPSLGMYGASKHAMLGYTSALQKELDPAWNIRATTIIPGGFTTGALGRSMVSHPLHPPYASSPGTVLTRKICADGSILCGGDINDAVGVFIKVAEMRREEQPEYLPVGMDSIGVIRGRLKELEEQVEKFAGLSEGIAKPPEI